MIKVNSKDNTPIGVYKYGTGPALLLVHGSRQDHKHWFRVLPHLENHFTVYTMDRRGRGGSGDAESYHMEREFEDVAAVAQWIAEPLYLFGHSYGGICSLEACLRINNLRKLILYEPPIQAGVVIQDPGVADEIQAQVDAGDLEGATATFYMRILRRTDTEIEKIRTGPSWQQFLRTVHILPRELHGVDNYRYDAARFSHLDVPKLFLLGELSPDYFGKVTRILHGDLKNSRISVMPGQHHAAMDTGPELLAREVIDFLQE